MLSASSGREQSRNSLSTTMAAARPRQRSGARWEEHRAQWGIPRPGGEAGAKKQNPRRQRNGMRDKEDQRREGKREGRGGPPTRQTSPLAKKGRGAKGRRGERGESGGRRPAPPHRG